jgi:hypothetical protein
MTTDEWRRELEADARRCGFDESEPLIALNDFKTWVEFQGFENCFFGRAPGKNPRHRFLIIRAKRHIYRLQLEPTPLIVRLDIVEPHRDPLGWSGTTLGWETTLDAEAWTTLKMRIMSAESGAPMPL